MVLIFNPEVNYTNYKLFDLFIANNIEFEVIDPTKIFSVKVEQKNNSLNEFSINDKFYSLKNISCVFSTSSNLNLCINMSSTDFIDFEDEVFDFFNSEWRKLNEFFSYLLKKKPFLSIPFDEENKLITNEIAKKNGFLIPDSIISTNLNEINNFFIEKGQTDFFSKRINGFLSGKTKEGIYFQHEGAVVKLDKISKFSDEIFPSVSQECIDSIIELRCLYVDREIFCVSKLLKSNRAELPFELPIQIKVKISQMMTDLDLNFGSLDFLIDRFNNYYFLEVNPHGQFDLIEVLGDKNVYEKIFKYIYEKEKFFT